MKLRLLLVGALLLAACSDAAADTDDGVASLEDATATTVVTVTDAMTAEDAAIAFTECMRDNGVDMEDPTVDADGNVTPGRPTNLGEGGADPPLGESMQSAFEECGEFLEGGAFGFTRADQTELQDQLIELAACLRDQGLDVADPDLSQLGRGNGGDAEPGQGAGPFGIDFQDPEVQEALENCEEFVPNFAGGGGPGTAD